tara:strand:+ start:307 stop:783 length:477 start_codon:yes stop_codon:yes gene_type:complete
MSIRIPSSRLKKEDGYLRPKKTLTDSIQNQKSITEYLKNFEEIKNDDLPYININTQLRYISYDKKNKCELFRFGGLLAKVDRDYIVLAGKEGKRFSVQRYTKDNNGKILHETRFFKKIKNEEIMQEEINNTVEVIDKQNDLIKKQKQEIAALKKKLKK